jgi:hypothetical protein
MNKREMWLQQQQAKHRARVERRTERRIITAAELMAAGLDAETAAKLELITAEGIWAQEHGLYAGGDTPGRFPDTFDGMVAALLTDYEWAKAQRAERLGDDE